MKKQSFKNYSNHLNKEKNHTQPATIQKFHYMAEDKTVENSLLNIIQSRLDEIKELEGVDIPAFEGLMMSIREIRESPNSLSFFVSFHDPEHKLSITPPDSEESVTSLHVQRKNEAELFFSIKGNFVYAGIMIASWNSLRKHLYCFLDNSKIQLIDKESAPITAFPDNDFFEKVKSKKIVAYGIGADISLSNLNSSARSPSMMESLFGKKKSSRSKITGHFMVDSNLNSKILPDDAEDILLKTDISLYLDEDNFFFTSDNKKLYPKDFLMRTTYYSFPYNYKTIRSQYAFDILKHHLQSE